jgi:hypothetical protein
MPKVFTPVDSGSYPHPLQARDLAPSPAGWDDLIKLIIRQFEDILMNLSPIQIFALLAVLAGVCVCGCTSQETVLTGEERASVLMYSDSVADTLLRGFNEDNYTMYSGDFGQEMKAALDEAAFEQNREFVVSRIGLYVSRGSPVVTESGGFIAVNYPAKFEREDGVNVRLVFRKGDASHQLSGLWFQSPELSS